jgi:hypothetical protein
MVKRNEPAGSQFVKGCPVEPPYPRSPPFRETAGTFFDRTHEKSSLGQENGSGLENAAPGVYKISIGRIPHDPDSYELDFQEAEV